MNKLKKEDLILSPKILDPIDNYNTLNKVSYSVAKSGGDDDVDDKYNIIKTYNIATLKATKNNIIKSGSNETDQNINHNNKVLVFNFPEIL